MVPSNIWFFRRGLPVKYSGAAAERDAEQRRDRSRSRSPTRASTSSRSSASERPCVRRCGGGARRADRSLGLRHSRIGGLNDHVHVQHAIGTVRAVDGDALLAPRTLEQIVQAVLVAMDERQLRDVARQGRHLMTAGVAVGSRSRMTTQVKKAVISWTGRIARASRRRSTSSTIRPSSASTRGDQFAEIAIPGLDAPLQQFVRGQAEKLTLDLFFDTTDNGMGRGRGQRHAVDRPDLPADQDRARAPRAADPAPSSGTTSFPAARSAARPASRRRCRDGDHRSARRHRGRCGRRRRHGHGSIGAAALALAGRHSANQRRNGFRCVVKSSSRSSRCSAPRVFRCGRR